MEINYQRGTHPNSKKNLISNYWIGKKMSEETKKKMSIAHKGKNTWSKGKQLSDEHRLKLSESAKKYWGPRVDKTHIALYERLRHSLASRFWREKVFKRDKYTCLWCGDKQGGNLEADHIKSFILIMRQHQIKSMHDAMVCEELWDIKNGRTLCKNCHKITDTWGAKSR